MKINVNITFVSVQENNTNTFSSHLCAPLRIKDASQIISLLLYFTPSQLRRRFCIFKEGDFRPQ